MSKYGVLSDVVAVSGSLMGSAYAITLAWTRRARWQPPEEDLPGSTAKVSALICAVAISVLYVLSRNELGTIGLSVIAGASVGITVIALMSSVFVNKKFSFDKPVYRGKTKTVVRILGGYQLTPEASRIQQERRISDQKMFEQAQGNTDLVWTRTSRAIVQVLSTAGYLFLQAFGSIGLAAAALLISIAIAQ